MRRLLTLILLLVAPPAGAPVRQPSRRLGGGLDGGDFLKVDQAFKPSVERSDAQHVLLRFVNAEGYYLYRHRFQFKVEPAQVSPARCSCRRASSTTTSTSAIPRSTTTSSTWRFPEQPGPAALYPGDSPGLRRQGPLLPPETRRLTSTAVPRRQPRTTRPARTRSNTRQAQPAVLLPRRPDPDLHPCVLPMLPDPLRSGPARPAGRWSRLRPVARLRAADGALLRPARRADGHVRRQPQSPGAIAVALGTGAIRGVLRAVRRGHVRLSSYACPASSANRSTAWPAMRAAARSSARPPSACFPACWSRPASPPRWPPRCSISAPAAMPGAACNCSPSAWAWVRRWWSSAPAAAPCCPRAEPG